MEWEKEEIAIVGVQDYQEAICSVLQKLIVNNGHIDLGRIDRTNMDYAIHLLRRYKALVLDGIPIEEPVR